MNNLIAPTTPIQFKSYPALKGIVLGICIRGKKMDLIEYQVSFISGADRKTDWVWDFEIEPIPQPRKAGFTANNNNPQTLIDK